ncbi:hypothetical protein FGO68_gene6177 [Halteria grandinella]|uniref:Uncharacterized protein n=1 Tax=Halteria grandinella TaxID=5974 RepID=A0A8J8NNY0_HALGN|nr:hypothetical protein FGO68_gene6177 [Halteria grandinella]
MSSKYIQVEITIKKWITEGSVQLGKQAIFTQKVLLSELKKQVAVGKKASKALLSLSINGMKGLHPSIMNLIKYRAKARRAHICGEVQSLSNKGKDSFSCPTKFDTLFGLKGGIPSLSWRVVIDLTPGDEQEQITASPQHEQLGDTVLSHIEDIILIYADTMSSLDKARTFKQIKQDMVERGHALPVLMENLNRLIEISESRQRSASPSPDERRAHRDSFDSSGMQRHLEQNLQLHHARQSFFQSLRLDDGENPSIERLSLQDQDAIKTALKDLKEIEELTEALIQKAQQLQNSFRSLRRVASSQALQCVNARLYTGIISGEDLKVALRASSLYLQPVDADVDRSTTAQVDPVRGSVQPIAVGAARPQDLLNQDAQQLQHRHPPSNPGGQGGAGVHQ